MNDNKGTTPRASKNFLRFYRFCTHGVSRIVKDARCCSKPSRRSITIHQVAMGLEAGLQDGWQGARSCSKSRFCRTRNFGDQGSASPPRRKYFRSHAKANA